MSRVPITPIAVRLLKISSGGVSLFIYIVAVFKKLGKPLVGNAQEPAVLIFQFLKLKADFRHGVLVYLGPVYGTWFQDQCQFVFVGAKDFRGAAEMFRQSQSQCGVETENLVQCAPWRELFNVIVSHAVLF